MNFIPSPKTKWSLTPEAFDKLLACLDVDRDHAGLKYVQTRRNLVRFFEGRGFSFAEDHADEVFNRVARKLEAGDDIREPASYFYGVARFVMLEQLKERQKESEALREVNLSPAVAPDETESHEDDQRLICLTNCLEKLPPESRSLIVEYYQGEHRLRIERRQKIAERLKLPMNALRSRAKRLREKLEICVKRCVKKAAFVTLER